jgi:hypothetical protein
MNITNDNANNAPTYFMSSPEPKVFPSRELLIDYWFNSARTKGYIMAKFRSSADDYFILSCDRGVQYRSFKNVPEEQRIRKSKTKKIECKVSIKGFYREGIW